LNPTQVYAVRVDEAFASGDKERLIVALYPLAEHITKHNMLATQFVVDHIQARFHLYTGIGRLGRKAEFST
jgi:hypothetical protein